MGAAFHCREQLADSKARIPKLGNGGAQEESQNATNSGERPKADIMK